MTVLLGPCPCASCGAIVTVVRRPVVIRGHAADCPKRTIHGWCREVPSNELTETLPVGPDGARHACPDFTLAHPFGYNPGAGASGETNRLNVAPVSQLAPGARASFHVGSKTT